ncbi:MAG TPA: PilN domain-containing protein [Pyrinomonadaceae bacterium]|nr:PilN domain-containing protein [Pyrinomonadaceae bacterium]
MIKINLLESIADRPTGVAMVEARVTSPRVQTILMAVTVFGLFSVGVGYDYVSSRSAHAAATQELNNQKLINQQMLAVNKEQAELEKKAKDIQGRIDAIKKLRESQQGPSAVLREIKARFDAVPGLYLKSVEQKEGELTIKGLSPNEAAVTRFGQSMEFSSGLFSNLNIETQREVVQADGAPSTPGALDKTVAATEVVAFTLKCNYGSKPENKQATSAVPNQVAKK